MGDPRKIRSSYKGPAHPWQKIRLEEESALLREFGLKNKKEVWKANSWLRRFTNNAKKLIVAKGKQSEIENEQMLSRLKSFGLIPESGTVADVLSINVKNVLERRLQSIVFRKNLARSMKQARQFITHEHIFIGEKKISVPSYMVTLKEEAILAFDQTSSLNDIEHPERTILEKKEVKEDKTEEKKGKYKKDFKKKNFRKRDFRKKETKKEVKKETIKKEEKPAEPKKETPKVEEKKENAPVKEEPKKESKKPEEGK